MINIPITIIEIINIFPIAKLLFNELISIPFCVIGSIYNVTSSQLITGSELYFAIDNPACVVNDYVDNIPYLYVIGGDTTYTERIDLDLLNSRIIEEIEEEEGGGGDVNVDHVI